MPALHTYEVEMTLVQRGIRAENEHEALAVMESNVDAKTYIKTERVMITRTDT
jgi:hypothetical protein